ELAEAAAKKGERRATTGAWVAVLLAESAIRGASLNCAINLASIRDEAFRSTAEERVDRLLKRADEIGHEAMAVVTGRLCSGPPDAIRVRKAQAATRRIVRRMEW